MNLHMTLIFNIVRETKLVKAITYCNSLLIFLICDTYCFRNYYL